jgi:hypothetical protein
MSTRPKIILALIPYYAQKAPHLIQYFSNSATLVHAIVVVGILIDGLDGLFDVGEPLQDLV